MERRIGVAKAIKTTVHAYTASQALVDGPSTHLRRGRAGAAVRGPVPIGSLADIVFLTTRSTAVDEVN